MATIKAETNRTRTQGFKVSETFSDDNRSFEAVLVSEDPVLMKTPDGVYYYEVLSCNPAHVDLTRAMSGAPLLDDHYSGGWRSQFGVVENPLFEGNKIRAQVRLSTREDVKELAADIKQGIIKNLSSGYSVFQYEDISAPGAKLQTLKAVKWRFNELSLKPVNADVNSRVRGLTEENELTEIPINTMDTPTPEVEVPAPNPVPTPAPAPAPTPAPAPAPANPVPAPDVAPAERVRALHIMEAAGVAAHVLPANFVKEHIAAGTTVEKVRELTIEALKTKSPLETQQGAHGAGVKVTQDVIDKTRGLVEIGIARKYGVGAQKDVPYTRDEIVGSEKYRSMTMVDIARDYIADTGDISILRDKAEIVGKRSLISTSSADFPVILEGVARRVLMAEYGIAADTWRRLAVTGSVGDFREWARLRGGTIGNLDKVNENGEFKNKAIPDGQAEKVKVETYGNTINVTRQMIINDDLGYFFRLAGMLARASARSIEAALYDLINMNGGLGPLMGDAKTLIHADHGNIGPNGAYSAVTVAGGRDVMKAQKDLSGNDFLDIRPEILLVPTPLADTAISLNINDYTNESQKYAQRNLYKGLFKDIIDSPRLVNQTRHYMLADKNAEPVFEVNFLNGNETPFMDERQEFDVDGTRWKIRHDWGVAAIGYKGIVSLPGA